MFGLIFVDVVDFVVVVDIFVVLVVVLVELEVELVELEVIIVVVVVVVEVVVPENVFGRKLAQLHLIKPSSDSKGALYKSKIVCYRDVT